MIRLFYGHYIMAIGCSWTGCACPATRTCPGSCCGSGCGSGTGRGGGSENGSETGTWT